jgi:hypothetical protein
LTILHEYIRGFGDRVGNRLEVFDADPTRLHRTYATDVPSTQLHDETAWLQPGTPPVLRRDGGLSRIRVRIGAWKGSLLDLSAEKPDSTPPKVPSGPLRRKGIGWFSLLDILGAGDRALPEFHVPAE